VVIRTRAVVTRPFAGLLVTLSPILLPRSLGFGRLRAGFEVGLICFPNPQFAGQTLSRYPDALIVPMMWKAGIGMARFERSRATDFNLVRSAFHRFFMRTRSIPARRARGRNWPRVNLRRHGFKILYRNFRGHRGGEIDLVCRDRDTLVFVEVKTRTREDFGRQSTPVSRSETAAHLVRRAGLVRLLGNPEILFRFDVVEVVITKRGRRASS